MRLPAVRAGRTRAGERLILRRRISPVCFFDTSAVAAYNKQNPSTSNKEAVMMRRRVLPVVGISAVLVVVVLLLTFARADQTSRAALKTAWGEPNLQGIWTDEYQTPLQRPAKYANKEFFTEEERAALDAQRSGIELRPRQERGTERDVAGAYNQVFMSIKRTGRRTSMIVDPPDGRTPPLTPDIQKQNAIEREFRLALLQATTTCQNLEPGCRGGKYGPPSPRREEVPPRYSTGNINRVDNPEDRSMSERCMAAVLPISVASVVSFSLQHLSRFSMMWDRAK